jgi:hypothetical protein
MQTYRYVIKFDKITTFAYNNIENIKEIFMGFFKKLFEGKEKEHEEMVTLNGKKITYSQLEEKKKEAKQQKGVRIVESSPKVFRTKIEG